MNISIIGMMGSGKTTVAKLLSEKLFEFSFIDTDDLIVKTENLPIVDIFAKKGENYFRKIENKVLADILKNNNQIISTGGGIILYDSNIRMLKEKSVVFFLNADADTIFYRLKNNKDRPLLNDGNMKDKINRILTERINRYKQAHYIINTDNMSPEAITEEIIRKSGLNGNS